MSQITELDMILNGGKTCLSVLNKICIGVYSCPGNTRTLQFIWWWQPWILLEMLKLVGHLEALSVLLRAA